MKKTSYILLLALASLSLVACSNKKPTNKNNKASSPSTSLTSSQSDTKPSPSTPSASSAPSAPPADIDTFESQEDSEKVLSKLSSLDSQPEWVSFKSIQLDSGVKVTVTDENGNTIEPPTTNKNPNPATYQDIINLLGQPSGGNEGNRMAIWQGNLGDITIFFTGNYANSKTISPLPNAKSISDSAISAIATGSSPESVLQQLGQPESVTVTTRFTSLSWKDSQGRPNSVMFINGVVSSTMNGADYERTAENFKQLTPTP